MYYRSRPNSGFSLVEVLVASILFSIGLLGVGTAFLKSEQSLRQALWRSQALSMISSAAETAVVMRDYLETKHSQEALISHLGFSKNPTDVPNTSNTLISALKPFERQVEQNLPSGKLELERSGSALKIRISWLGDPSNHGQTGNGASDARDDVTLEVFL